MDIQLNKRQEDIIKIVKKSEPITSERIAEKLKVTRSAIRSDLAVLTMSGILEARPKVGYYYLGKNKDSLISEYIKKIPITLIKSFPVVIKETTSVYDAIVTLFLEDIGTLFIINNSEDLAGVVSRKDLLKIAIGNNDIHKMPVSIIMTRMPNIIKIESDNTLYEAALKIYEHEIDALPVVENKDTSEKQRYKIIGKVTKTDITRVFVEIGKDDLKNLEGGD